MKAVGKNHEDRQDEAEEPESIIPGIERLVESAPPGTDRKIRGAHLAIASRNRAATDWNASAFPSAKNGIIANRGLVAQF